MKEIFRLERYLASTPSDQNDIEIIDNPISKKEPENVASITVTDENLGIGAYANGSKVVTGVKFSYTQLGKYDFDIQMRYKNNVHSSICNATPFDKKLEKYCWIT